MGAGSAAVQLLGQGEVTSGTPRSGPNHPLQLTRPAKLLSETSKLFEAGRAVERCRSAAVPRLGHDVADSAIGRTRVNSHWADCSGRSTTWILLTELVPPSSCLSESRFIMWREDV